MPQEIVVTLKTQQPGGVWPILRGAFAWVGFGVVVGVGASILDAPNPGSETGANHRGIRRRLAGL
jgi:hypothetical protein